MVTTPDEAGSGVVSRADAGISTYSLIVALRPRPQFTVSPPPPPVCKRLRTFGLWAPCHLLGSPRPLELRFVYRRGRRAGRRVQRARPSPSSADRCLRSSSPPAADAPLSSLVFGTLNIRSLLNKFDGVVEVCRDRHLDVLCLTETWHDSDSPVIGRLQGAGFSVIHRPRPRAVDDISPNHGGVAVVAAPGITISPLPSLSDQPTTFELVGARVVSGRFTGIVITLYRPGSAAVLQSFFDELAAVLDRVATYQEPVYVIGDYNIRLDRPDDPHAIQLRQLVKSYGLLLHDTCSTHQLGGTLDAVVTRADSGCPEQVDVFDVGLSDHHLLQWSVDATRQAPPTTVAYCRAWRRLDYDDFRATLSSSRLCQPTDWPDDVDEMASVYDLELTRLLDQLISARQVIVVHVILTPGSMASVVMLSASDAGSSVGTPQSVGELLTRLRSTQPRPPGTTIAVPTGSCVSRSAPRSGPSGLMLTEPILGSYGGR